VLDDASMWEETSCSAAFAYGFARAASRGWVDASYLDAARRAFTSIASRVGPDGAVEGTCQGTVIGMDTDYYARRGRPHDDEHGPGLVLLAGTELLAPG
jgi:rhamnogalacturonyl hydrolase YesR